MLSIGLTTIPIPYDSDDFELGILQLGNGMIGMIGNDKAADLTLWLSHRRFLKQLSEFPSASVYRGGVKFSSFQSLIHPPFALPF